MQRGYLAISGGVLPLLRAAEPKVRLNLPQVSTKSKITDTGHPFIRFVDLSSATPEEINQLSTACDLATFGRGEEDIYDETYRKAVKMDASNFAVQFDPVRAGLIKTIEEQLLRSQKEEMSINAEIYKLNVYGDPQRLSRFDLS